MEPVPKVPYKALVIDDNSDLRVVFSHIFKLKGFEIESAANGKDAITKLETYHPDVIILDINMPEMSGLDLLTYLKSNAPLANIKIIVVTGNFLAEQAPEIQLADLFLIKPVSVNELATLSVRLIKGNLNTID